jgi:flagellar hook-associated protein 1 FlgK
MGMSITLNTAAQALLAQQMGVDTTSHNISNATTAGYSRQRISQVAIPGSYDADGRPHPGLGVEIVDITRIRDAFVDYQVRSQLSGGAQYDAKTLALTNVENIMGEPGEAGLRASIDQFFNAWRDLANNPESGPARIAVTQAGQALALAANRLGSTLVQTRSEANARLRDIVPEVNALTAEIADLNRQIVPMKMTGTSVGDLEDRRDVAIDRLAQLMNISYMEADDGHVEISTGGHALVSGWDAYAIEGIANPLNSNYINLRFVADSVPLTVTAGEIRAHLDMRDSYVPARITELDTLIAKIITDVNTAHAAAFGLDGVTGRAFFTGTGAATIALDAVVAGNPNAVAAASTLAGVPGDASAAQTISGLQFVKGLSGGTQTYNEYYGSLVSGIGVTLQEAQSRGEAQNLVLDQLKMQRESTSGVNLDEEMVSLVRYQRAYEAASKLVAVADEMLDTLINRMI